MNISHYWGLLLVPAAIIYVALAMRQHHQTVGDTEIYRVPYAYTFLCFAGFVFFEILPLWKSVPSDAVSFVVYHVFFPLPFFVVWLRNLMYRVEVTGSKVVVGAFPRHQFDMHDVVDSDLTEGRAQLLSLRLRNGKKRYISGYIADFKPLAAKLVRQVGRID